MVSGGLSERTCVGEGIRVGGSERMMMLMSMKKGERLRFAGIVFF